MKAQPLKCDDYSPPIPAGLYKGHAAQFPSVTEAMKTVHRRGSHFPAEDGYSEYYEFHFANRKYFAYPTPAGVEVNLIEGDDPVTLHNAGIAYIRCMEEDTGPYWWIELRVWRGENDDRYCTLSVFNISDSSKSDKSVPSGSIYYLWQCFKRTGKEEYRPYQYTQTMEWNEVIFPDGRVYWPGKRTTPDGPIPWVLADEKRSWLHHPELIPKEVRFDDDPMIKLLLTGEEE